MPSLGVTEKAGVLVDVVFEDTPAYRAQLLAEDVILSVNGTAVTDVRQIRSLVANIMPGDPATFRVWRDREERVMRVRLGRQAEDFGQPSFITPRAIVAREIDPLGIHARSLRTELFDPRFGPLFKNGYAAAFRRGRHVPTDHGVLIVDAVRGGALSDIEIEPGDVLIECDGKKVASVTDLNLALVSAGLRGRVKLKVLDPDGDKKTIYVKLAER